MAASRDRLLVVVAYRRGVRRIASPFLKGAMRRATAEEARLLGARVEALPVRPG